MPTYFYTAKTIDGVTKKGNSEAEDIHKLARSLREEGLILIDALSDKERKEKRKIKIKIPFLSSRVSATEKIIMTRNLSVMVSTGLSLVKSFDILSTQTRSRRLRSVLSNVRDKINKGVPLSDALSEYPEIFSNIFLSMVKVGEEAGTLEEVFKTLSVQMEKERNLKSKVQNAMIYPVVLLLTILGAGIVVVAVVIPRLNAFFSTFGTDIPIYTRIILNSGNFAAQQWPWLLISPIVLIMLLWMAAKTRAGKKFIDSFLLKLPFFSLLVKESNCAILIRSLSSLISSGVPLIRSLEISSGVANNYYFKKAMNDAAGKVKKGENFSSALQEYKKIFPFGTIEMIRVGEETGKTATILKKLADFYEDELSNATEKLSAALEPILILTLGISVGIFAISIISPMYSMLGSIY